MQKFLGAGILATSLTVLQAIAQPPTSAPAKGQEAAILEVSGDKREAIRILRRSGFNSVELKDSAYTLPSVDIVAPPKVTYGKLVVVTAKLDKNKMPANLIQVKYQWCILWNGSVTDDYLPWPDGTKIALGTGIDPGKYTVILDVDCVFGVEKTENNQTVFTNVEINSPGLSTRDIQVGPDTPPSPSPNPVPVPPAPVVLPDGQFKMAQFSYNAMMTDSLLSPSERVLVAKALSTSFSGIAGSIAALQSNPPTVDTLMAQTKTANESAIRGSGVDYAKTNGIKKTLGDRVFEAVYGPTPAIKTAADVAVAWREIATGLDAVK